MVALSNHLEGEMRKLSWESLKSRYSRTEENPDTKSPHWMVQREILEGDLSELRRVDVNIHPW